MKMDKVEEIVRVKDMVGKHKGRGNMKGNGRDCENSKSEESGGRADNGRLSDKYTERHKDKQTVTTMHIATIFCTSYTHGILVCAKNNITLFPKQFQRQVKNGYLVTCYG